MRIGINCLGINPDYVGGINSYTFGLISGFAKVGKKHAFQIYVSDKNQLLFDRYKKYKNITVYKIPQKKILINYMLKIIRKFSLLISFKELYELSNNYINKDNTKFMDDKSDIIYTPTTVLLSTRYIKKTVVSLHDIQHVHYPEFFSKNVLKMRNLQFSMTAEKADYIQVSSKYIKDDLLNYFQNLNKKNIVKIPEGVSVNLFDKYTYSPKILEKYKIPSDFLFFPAQLWKHKNHITVLKALNNLKNFYKFNIPLVLTGAKYSCSKCVFDYIHQHNLDNIYYLGKIPFEDIPSIYKNAKFLISASLHESSSLPVLEAAAAKVPIIASNIPPHIEMSNKLKLNLFSPLDDKQLAKLIYTIWNKKKLIKEQINHNYNNINYYSWSNVAKKYLKFFENIF